MAATTVYLSDVEISLILESIDMLEHDYEDNHPEQEKLEKIKEEFYKTLRRIEK